MVDYRALAKCAVVAPVLGTTGKGLLACIDGKRRVKKVGKLLYLGPVEVT